MRMKNPWSGKRLSQRRFALSTNQRAGQVKRLSEELKEVRSKKRLLVLLLLKGGATSEEIDLATAMGAGNVRTEFPRVKRRFQIEQAK